MALDGINGANGTYQGPPKTQDDFDAFVEKAYSGIPDRTSTIQEKEAAIKAKKAIMQHPKCPSSTKPELQREIQIIQAEIDRIKAGPSIFMQE